MFLTHSLSLSISWHRPLLFALHGGCDRTHYYFLCSIPILLMLFYILLSLIVPICLAAVSARLQNGKTADI